MLYNVSNGIQRMALNTVRRHPNSWSVQFFRKVIERTADSDFGGMPTLGGAAMLDSADEPAYHYEFLANGYAMRAETFMGQGMSMAEAKDAPMGGDETMTYALATDLPPPPALGETAPPMVELTTKDLVLFVLGDTPDAARLAFEIATLQPTMEMPPYLPRYVLNRRADFDIPVGGDVPDVPSDPLPSEEPDLPPENGAQNEQENPVNSASFLE